jgi:hypothetical protein
VKAVWVGSKKIPGRGDFDEMTIRITEVETAPRPKLYLVSMPLGVVFVSLAIFLVPRRLV